ncbi:MAG TPA: hypothetical protein VJP86_15760 [Vicinamibacterales bacterium]|nr:hypothetical protein [Vicinamibacterales bacterium]
MSLAQWVLAVLGAGFLVANAILVAEYFRYLKRRRGALLTWPGPPPPYYGTKLAIGTALGVLVFYKTLVLRMPAFGEGMMFVYYGYLVPLTRRIARGFYREGIWADSRFIPYNEVGGITWREGEHSASLIVISRLRNLAQRLAVPAEHYAAARRLLRDKIGAHEIHFSGTGLDLGEHDERDQA